MNIFGLIFFRQIPIYLGLPKMGKYEYVYNYLDWSLRIQKQIKAFSPKKQKKYVCRYERYKSMTINAHMCYKI